MSLHGPSRSGRGREPVLVDREGRAFAGVGEQGAMTAEAQTSQKLSMAREPDGDH